MAPFHVHTSCAVNSFHKSYKELLDLITLHSLDFQIFNILFFIKIYKFTELIQNITYKNTCNIKKTEI